MAYFGRTPKKPSQKPGAGSGNTRADRAVARFLRLAPSVANRERQARIGRPGRVNRAVRATRSSRSAR